MVNMHNVKQELSLTPRHKARDCPIKSSQPPIHKRSLLDSYWSVIYDLCKNHILQHIVHLHIYTVTLVYEANYTVEEYDINSFSKFSDIV